MNPMMMPPPVVAASYPQMPMMPMNGMLPGFMQPTPSLEGQIAGLGANVGAGLGSVLGKLLTWSMSSLDRVTTGAVGPANGGYGNPYGEF